LSNRCRYPPAEIRRQLRQESGFGCAICGNPLLQNAHIIEYHLTQETRVEDMIALCPDCHVEADAGHYPKKVLRDYKANPYNKNRSILGKKFLVTGEDMIVNIGSFKLINTERVLVVNDFDLITIQRVEGYYLSLDVNLFDKFGNFIAVVYENNWQVDINYFWDVEYKAQHLTLRSAPRKITLEIKIENEEVFITGNMYYNGFPINIERGAITIGNNKLIGWTVKNAGIGIVCQV
jgi:hypothetical protein